MRLKFYQRHLRAMEEIERQDQDEVAEIGTDQAANVNEKHLEEQIIELKGEKRIAKSRMTRLLNNMATMISELNTEHKDVKEILLRIDEQQEETLHIMNKLEIIYQRNKDHGNARKVNDEADSLVDQVKHETKSARTYLTSLAKKLWSSSSATTTTNQEPREGDVSK